MDKATLDKEIKKAEARVSKINTIREREVVKLGPRRQYWKRIPWDIFTLDATLGCDKDGMFGIPEGAVIELLGDEGTCKSTLALKAVREFQKAGKLHAAWMDGEKWLTRDRMIDMGVEPDLVEHAVPQTLEEAVDTVHDWVLSGEYDIIVFDSIGALATGEEIEKSTEDRATAQIASKITRMVKNLNSASASLEVMGKDFPTMFFINQFYYKVGGYGDPRVPKGGKHFRFFVDVSIHLSRLPDGIMYELPEIGMHEEVGRQLSFQIWDKNRTSTDETMRAIKKDVKVADRYEALFALFLKKVPDWGYNEVGMSDNARQIVLLSIKYGFIRKSGAWFYLPDNTKFQGSAQLMEYMKDPANEKALAELKIGVSNFIRMPLHERAASLRERKQSQEK